MVNKEKNKTVKEEHVEQRERHRGGETDEDATERSDGAEETETEETEREKREQPAALPPCQSQDCACLAAQPHKLHLSITADVRRGCELLSRKQTLTQPCLEEKRVQKCSSQCV